MLLADFGKQERIEEFLRKSLLGEELINIQFHLYSTRSVPSDRVAKPRVLCANNVLLARSSKYFLDLFSSEIIPAGLSLSDLTDANDVPSYVRMDGYGYGSDSDLDDDDEQPSIPFANIKDRLDESATISTTLPRLSITIQPKDDDELSDDGSESVSSDMFVMSPEHPRGDEPFGNFSVGETGSVTSGKTAVQERQGNKLWGNEIAMRLRSLGSRHILVKDTAFKTWYSLLNYLYTDKVNFLPLGSATPGKQPHDSSANSQDEPRCSSKSMYRLACKVGLDHLRDEALAYIRSNLTEHNILKELSCSMLSSHPQLLEMELDMLYAHIGSAPVVAGFPALAQRIAHKELPHGADIVIGIHARLLEERLPLPSAPRTVVPDSPISPPALFGLGPSPVIAETPSDTIENEFPVPPLRCEWGGGWGFGAQPLGSSVFEDPALGGPLPVDTLPVDPPAKECVDSKPELIQGKKSINWKKRGKAKPY